MRNPFKRNPGVAFPMLTQSSILNRIPNSCPILIAIGAPQQKHRMILLRRIYELYEFECSWCGTAWSPPKKTFWGTPKRPLSADMRLKGEPYCRDCPDWEQCSFGVPCDSVRTIKKQRSSDGPWDTEIAWVRDAFLTNPSPPLSANQKPGSYEE